MKDLLVILAILIFCFELYRLLRGNWIRRFLRKRKGASLVLGVDASALEEVFGVREITIRTWLCRSGMQGRKLHEQFMAELELIHMQLDELHPALRALAA